MNIHCLNALHCIVKQRQDITYCISLYEMVYNNGQLPFTYTFSLKMNQSNLTFLSLNVRGIRGVREGKFFVSMA